MKNDTINSIKKVLANRLANGASFKSIIGYLHHLKSDTWKDSPLTIGEIGEMEKGMYRFGLKEFIISIKQEKLKKHRDEAKITCSEDCWCWEVEASILEDEQD